MPTAVTKRGDLKRAGPGIPRTRRVLQRNTVAFARLVLSRQYGESPELERALAEWCARNPNAPET